MGGGATPPPPSGGDGGDDGEDDEGMLRMSFLEHLQELRSRILKSLVGIVVAFTVSLTFCNWLWDIVSQPAVEALKTLGVNPPELVVIEPMEGINVIWFKLPIVCAIFLASPWARYISGASLVVHGGGERPAYLQAAKNSGAGKPT